MNTFVRQNCKSCSAHVLCIKWHFFERRNNILSKWKAAQNKVNKSERIENTTVLLCLYTFDELTNICTYSILDMVIWSLILHGNSTHWWEIYECTLHLVYKMQNIFWIRVSAQTSYEKMLQAIVGRNNSSFRL